MAQNILTWLMVYAVKGLTAVRIILDQWFSTFSLKGAKSRPTTLLEKSQMTSFVLLQKSVAQNTGVFFFERLLRAAQRVLGSRMRLSKQWLRTTGQDKRFKRKHAKIMDSTIK